MKSLIYTGKKVDLQANCQFIGVLWLCSGFQTWNYFSELIHQLYNVYFFNDVSKKRYRLFTQNNFQETCVDVSLGFFKPTSAVMIRMCLQKLYLIDLVVFFILGYQENWEDMCFFLIILVGISLTFHSIQYILWFAQQMRVQRTQKKVPNLLLTNYHLYW